MKKLNVESSDLNRVQDLIGDSVEPIEKSPIWRGIVVSDVVLTSASANSVAHRLGREPKGYLVLSRSANANIWDSPSTMADKFLSLNTDANVTVKLWVF